MSLENEKTKGETHLDLDAGALEGLLEVLALGGGLRAPAAVSLENTHDKKAQINMTC